MASKQRAVFRRPTWQDLKDRTTFSRLVAQAEHEGRLSPHTHSALKRPIVDLDGLLRDSSASPSLPWSDRGCTIDRDLGVAEHTTGNASGGQWSGTYRSFFAIGHGAGAVLSFMVAASDESPRATPSKTYLIIALGSGVQMHNSLQLDLEKYAHRTDEGLELWHDGRLTSGRSGPAKQADVVRFVAEAAPDLVRGGTVRLGTLPTDRGLAWSDVRPTLTRLAQYALIRDRWREVHR